MRPRNTDSSLTDVQPPKVASNFQPLYLLSTDLLSICERRHFRRRRRREELLRQVRSSYELLRQVRLSVELLRQVGLRYEGAWLWRTGWLNTTSKLR